MIKRMLKQGASQYLYNINKPIFCLSLLTITFVKAGNAFVFE